MKAAAVIRDEHAALRAVLHALQLKLREGPGDDAERFFDVLRAMLFYIDEFPEKLHHPRESDLLFPRIARARPALLPLIRRLEFDHMRGEGRVRELQHQLLAWELAGESRRSEFEEAADAYARFYLEHMRVEEAELLPAALEFLDASDWVELDAAFVPDPLAGGSKAGYERLLSRVALAVPGHGVAVARVADPG
ncbi:hemerythrin domain-containing protein [Caenimonas sedimenti]|uniref:Hemerythrin domain-containing protein n=1 Tax=Caenimonas sedimenti TaxID=2596921 RepID=A0A562ZVU9_9BURK|nr:hemerythrin domain-containing protein [Caenimonas sedimenti]TWO72700.1 hemerythrin domain-containing protein [Caenimonas sedimenti]